MGAVASDLLATFAGRLVVTRLLYNLLPLLLLLLVRWLCVRAFVFVCVCVCALRELVSVRVRVCVCCCCLVAAQQASEAASASAMLTHTERAGGRARGNSVRLRLLPSAHTRMSGRTIVNERRRAPRTVRFARLSPANQQAEEVRFSFAHSPSNTFAHETMRPLLLLVNASPSNSPHETQ